MKKDAGLCRSAGLTRLSPSLSVYSYSGKKIKKIPGFKKRVLLLRLIMKKHDIRHLITAPF